MTTTAQPDAIKVVVESPESKVQRLREQLETLTFPAEFKRRRPHVGPRHVRTRGGEERFGGQIGAPIVPGTEDLPVLKSKLKKVEVIHHRSEASRRVEIVQHGARGKLVTSHPDMAHADEHLDAILEHHDHLDSVHHDLGGSQDKYEVFHDGSVTHTGPDGVSTDLGKMRNHRDGTISLRGVSRRAEGVSDLLHEHHKDMIIERHRSQITPAKKAPAKKAPAKAVDRRSRRQLEQDAMNAGVGTRRQVQDMADEDLRHFAPPQTAKKAPARKAPAKATTAAQDTATTLRRMEENQPEWEQIGEKGGHAPSIAGQLGTLKRGDRVRLDSGGQVHDDLTVQQELHRTDGGFGSLDHAVVTVGYGPGRWNTEVSAAHIRAGYATLHRAKSSEPQWIRNVNSDRAMHGHKAERDHQRSTDRLDVIRVRSPYGTTIGMVRGVQDPRGGTVWKSKLESEGSWKRHTAPDSAVKDMVKRYRALGKA